MNSYTEKHFFLNRTTLTFVSKDTLLFEKKTPLSCVKEMIPLVAFSATPQINKNELSALAKWLWRMELMGIVLVLIKLIFDPAFRELINVPVLFASFVILLACSALYYWRATTTSLIFFSNNTSQAIFKMNYSKNDIEQKKFIDVFTAAVMEARIHFNQTHFLNIEKGIKSLRKQGLITGAFAQELHQRLGSLVNTKI